MSEPPTAVPINEGRRSGVSDETKTTLMTGGSVIGALAMSSCCVAPFALFSLGVSGAWIGNLTALYPYKLWFFTVTVVFLASGFYMVYRKPRAAKRETGSCCASPLSESINKGMLWSASLLVLAATVFPYVAPIILDE